MIRRFFLTLVLVCGITLSFVSCKKKPNPENEIVWAFPILNFEPFREDLDTGFMELREQALNGRLLKDGYDFSVKFLLVPSEGLYDELLKGLDADIANLGGINNGNSAYKPAETLLKEGVFTCLDDYLEGSRLQKTIPDICWETVKYQNKVYCIPQMISDGSQTVVHFNPEKTTLDSIRDFNGDLSKLSECFGDDFKIYYNKPTWPLMFNYVGYKTYKSLLFDSEGNVVNPFKDEKCIALTKTLEKLNEEGHLTTKAKERAECVAGFGITSNPNFKNDSFYFFNCPWAITTSYSLNLGILETSSKKDIAFKILDIFLTDPAYGNILMYGNENPANTDTASTLLQMRLGLRDFIEPLGGFSFKSVEERNAFYKDVVYFPTKDVSDLEETAEIEQLWMEYSNMLYLDSLAVENMFGTEEAYRKALKEFETKLSNLIDAIIEKSSA